MNFKRFHESKNLFDPDVLLEAVGWEKHDNIYSGYSNELHRKFNSFDKCIPVDATIANIKVMFKYENLNTALFVVFWYTDGTSTQSSKNGKSGEWTYLSGESDSNKTLKGIAFSFGTNDLVKLKEIMLNSGSEPLPYEPYDSEVWHDTPHYIHKTDTDTITTPADIYVNDNNATVGLKGNMSQSSTPSPDSPIQPQECGERTANLFDYVSYFQTIQPWSKTLAGDYFDYGILHLSPNTTYTFSTNFHTGISGSQQNVRDVPFIAVDSNTNPSTAIGGFGDDGSVTVTTLSDGIIRLFKRIQRGSSPIDLADLPTLSDFQNGKWVMCNDGSTTLPYEPYGYKIPILNNSQTTNVYLGETESTRRIKKLVLTGEETIRLQSINEYNIANFYISLLGLVVKDGLSSHFEKQTTIIGQTQTEGYFLAYSAQDTTLFIRISVSRSSTTTEMQTWLSNQYTNGTPVTFWYTTEEPTTGIVNEPIRKIGDYADEVSNISIPTIAGANTISVDTTLQPSEVSVNYKGWHPVSAVHERESGAWT